MLRKISSLLISLSLIFQQVGFASMATELNIAGHLSKMPSSLVADRFRPVHIRFFSFDAQNDNIKVMLDKGDVKSLKANQINESTEELLNYFLVGITLPNDKFWVNLRPDSEDNIIDNWLAKTDVGKIMLEADLQLKKDTAQFTSPQTAEGKEYWNRLYKKAEELYGYQQVSIPTLTRPWIVPNEVIVRESKESAYIYKATLKVMLEQDFLKDSSVYNFKDDRAKALNEYSSQLIRELIIPKLTQEVNLSKRYAPLRQVYYSIVLSRWFKSRFANQTGKYASRIDRRDLTGLASATAWSKSTYFDAYKKSFAQGEYNIKETVRTPTGQVIRSYFSGGADFATMQINGGIASSAIEQSLLTAGLVAPIQASSPISINEMSYSYKMNELVQQLLLNLKRQKDVLPLVEAAPLANTSAASSAVEVEGIKKKFSQLVKGLHSSFDYVSGFPGVHGASLTIESFLKTIDKWNEDVSKETDMVRLEGLLRSAKATLEAYERNPELNITMQNRGHFNSSTIDYAIKIGNSIGNFSALLNDVVSFNSKTADLTGKQASSAMQVKRPPIVGANWKMSAKEIDTEAKAVQLLRDTVADIKAKGALGVETVLAPTDLHISAVSKALKELVDAGEIPEGTIQLAVQNISADESGAQTGRTSVLNLKEYYGVKYIIIGHSEQRRDKTGIIRESDGIINKKVKLALKNGFKVILCVGEDLFERENGNTNSIVEWQVMESLADVTPEEIDSVVIAYEPVWAIGTGKTATPEEAQEVHKFIRRELFDLYGDIISSKSRIQYGGSVKPENAAELKAQPDIDGFLVGGASLKADSFGTIVKAAASSAISIENQQKILGQLSKKTDSKVIYLVMDGLGGLPVVDGKTELEIAKTPNLDALVKKSDTGLVNVMDTLGIIPGSGPGHFAIFGYDAFQGTGRGILDALGAGVQVEPGDIVARGNLATVSNGVITDRRAGRIETRKTQEIVKKYLSDIEIDGVKFIFYSTAEHRLALVIRGKDISLPIGDSDPGKEGLAPAKFSGESAQAKRLADLMNKLTEEANRRLRNNSVDDKANVVVFRGFDVLQKLPSLGELYKLNPAAICTYPAYKGIAENMGMQVMPVPGSGTLEDQVKVLEQTAKDHDFIYFHVKTTDKYGEDGNAAAKVHVIEEVDSLIPRILALMDLDRGDTLVVLGDHSTPAAMRSHSDHAVPIAVYTKYTRPTKDVTRFTEEEARKGSLGIISGSNVLPLALGRSGKLGTIDGPIYGLSSSPMAQASSAITADVEKRIMELKKRITERQNRIREIGVDITDNNKNIRAYNPTIFSNDRGYVEELKQQNIGNGEAILRIRGEINDMAIELRELNEKAKKVSSSSIEDLKGPVGGIDFRAPALTIKYQPMGNFAGLNPKLPVLSKAELAVFNIDQELSGMEKLVNSQMIPSGDRLKEVLAACSQKGELTANKERLMALLVKIGIAEETQCCLQEASNEYKEALVLADSLA